MSSSEAIWFDSTMCNGFTSMSNLSEHIHCDLAENACERLFDFSDLVPTLSNSLVEALLLTDSRHSAVAGHALRRPRNTDDLHHLGIQSDQQLDVYSVRGHSVNF
jgi:hypothetical protein